MNKEKIFKTSPPKVSVILSSYNHAKYISSAIESVLNQTFTDFELLIADDGSQDNSREIIKTFDDPRIKFFLHEENRGPRIMLSECVKAAQGKYIAIHHSDDSWTSDKLEKQVNFLDAHKDYAACFTQANFIDENGNLQELADDDFYKKVFEQPNRSRAEWLRYFFYNANCLCHPSLMIRREIYEKYNLLDFHGLWQLPDYFMWIKLCFHENFYIMPEKLTEFRLRRGRQENMSAWTFEKLVRAESEFFFVMQNFLDEFKDDKFFLEVFPETEKFLVDGEINRNFAFAQICFEKPQNYFQLIGLEILKKLLGDEKSAAQIKKLYDYDEKKFLVDTGRFDVFGVAQKVSVIHSEIFVGDGLESLSSVAKKFFYFDGEGNFFGTIKFFSEKPFKILRFDPDEKFISVKPTELKINGVDYTNNLFHNEADFVNGFYRFRTDDPQFIFETDNLSGEIIFEIVGQVEPNYQKIFVEEFQEMKRQLQNSQEEIRQLQEKILQTQKKSSLKKFGSWIKNIFS